jgi:hypothetical protein
MASELQQHLPATADELYKGFSKEKLEILKPWTVKGPEILEYLKKKVGVEFVLGSNGLPLGKFVEARFIDCGAQSDSGCRGICKNSLSLLFEKDGTLQSRGVGELEWLGIIPV